MPKRTDEKISGSTGIIDSVVIAQKAVEYAKLKKAETELKGEIAKKNGELKGEFKSSGLGIMNGKHLEYNAPLGDGVNEVFIQIQNKESVSMVDNIIGLVREKLGEKAEKYIYTQEVIHDNALEAMFNSGLITEEDVASWTTIKTVESLVVKVNKSSKK